MLPPSQLVSIVVAVAVCTLGAAMLALALLRAAASRQLTFTGLFACSYGVRLLLNTPAFAEVLARPRWLDYARADLEYLVPLAGVVLFAEFGPRWKQLNRAAIGLFATFCAIAIPYELIERAPFAVKPIVDTLVIVLIVVFAVDIFASSAERRLRAVRFGALVFVAFVANEHGHWLHDSLGLLREPIGFLVFLVTIVYSTMRYAIDSQQRLIAVDGELATARRIQQSILPRRNPELRGLSVDAVYAPASDVAGDFYEFVELDAERLGVIVADVSGHGVPAALVASMLKVAVASLAMHAASPATLMRELNALFIGKLERQFITAVYALIDVGRESITIASAGHPPALLVHGGSARELSPPGMLLGRFRNGNWSEERHDFRSGDALVLYTDGVTEALDGREEEYGFERLQSRVAAADATPNALAAEVRGWSRGALADDVTIVVVRRG